MILNALRVALRIDSGIMILICISAKPAGLAEMLFSQEGSELSDAVFLCGPFWEKAIPDRPQSVRYCSNKK